MTHRSTTHPPFDRGSSRAAALAAPGTTRLLAALAALVAVAACRDGAAPQESASTGIRRQAQVGAIVEQTAAAPTCDASETATHDAHTAAGIDCTVCHPAGGRIDIATTPLPGGTIPGGTVNLGSEGTPTTCQVGCHSPLGTPPQPIAWNAGAQTCISCHRQMARTATTRSSHATSNDRAACLACHDTTRHMSGDVRFVTGTAGDGDALCLACHLGHGAAIDGRTPPVLVGWSDPTAGDWHGARAGTGYGGTLAPPHARGAEPLACADCHDAHVSDHAYLFARTVNGAPVVGAQVARNGAGAEVLCASCHRGERHAGCVGCHTVDPIAAGQACFWCHGHEGMRNFPVPNPNTDHQTGDCTHCHQRWRPAADAVSPVVTSIAVREVGPSTATVIWTTGEKATSWVEHGVGGFDHVAGDAALLTAHTVRLTDLAPATAYSFRIRSADAMRNTTLSAPQTFTTGVAGSPTAPALIDEPNTWTPTTTAAVTLEWLPTTSPDGDAVEYRVTVSSRADFATVVSDSGWIAARRHDVTVRASIGGLTYYWRVVARDVLHGHESGPSVDSFVAMVNDPSAAATAAASP